MYVVITAATTSIAVAATLTIKAAHSAGRVMLPVSVKVLLWWAASVAEAIRVGAHGRSHAIPVAMTVVASAMLHGTATASWPTIELLVWIGSPVIRATAIETIVSHRTSAATILAPLLRSPEAVTVATSGHGSGVSAAIVAARWAPTSPSTVAKAPSLATKAIPHHTAATVPVVEAWLVPIMEASSTASIPVEVATATIPIKVTASVASATTPVSTTKSAPTATAIKIASLGGWLALRGFSGRDFDTHTASFPERVVKTRNGRFGVIVAFHVNESELFEDVTLDNLTELLE